MECIQFTNECQMRLVENRGKKNTLRLFSKLEVNPRPLMSLSQHFFPVLTLGTYICFSFFFFSCDFFVRLFPLVVIDPSVYFGVILGRPVENIFALFGIICLIWDRGLKNVNPKWSKKGSSEPRLKRLVPKEPRDVIYLRIREKEELFNYSIWEQLIPCFTPSQNLARDTELKVSPADSCSFTFHLTSQVVAIPS